MAALHIDAVSFRPLPPLVLTERFQPVSTSVPADDAIFISAGAAPPADEPNKGLQMTPYQAFASKNPRSPSRAARFKKTKGPQIAARRAVLVVDDVPDVTEMIELLLKHAGYEVSTADSAQTALRLARKTNYDLIISDIGMPEMNGYELATALRALRDYSHTPMIAVTGYSEYDDRGRAVRAGFDVHLTKPIEPAQLLNLMTELLSRPESNTDH